MMPISEQRFFQLPTDARDQSHRILCFPGPSVGLKRRSIAREERHRVNADFQDSLRDGLSLSAVYATLQACNNSLCPGPCHRSRKTG